MSTKILLESGTNELQILEFNVGNNVYGINIAKVSEIMTDQEITPIPNGPDEVEGVFIPRDQLITVIDLHKVLHIPNPGNQKSVIIVCQFNKMQVAFHVTKVNGFQRISWTDIVEPPAVSSSEGMGISTGVAKINGRIIMILDLERIVSDLNRSSGLDVTGLTEIDKASINAGKKRVVVADDSPFLNKMITSTLSEMGLSNIVSFQNGEDAWDYVSSFRNKEGAVTDHVACVISDIEMPKMDGHRLTKLIKDDPVLKDIPVILFSSLIDEQMILKCKAVGADAQFSKPQISELIRTLLKLISEE
ncbi:MAG: chemotaxis protein [Oscillospiraceae bacterium]|nr:chemotaxis protein [Oscillospiraceae bacterium]